MVLLCGADGIGGSYWTRCLSCTGRDDHPDLFSQGDEGYAHQPEIVQDLAEAKLDVLADEYRLEGWYEVSAALDQPYDLYSKG